MKGSEADLFKLREEVNKMSIETEGFKEQLALCNAEELRLGAEINGLKELIAQLEQQQENAEELTGRSESDLKKYALMIEESEKQLLECEKNITAISDEIEKADEGIKEKLRARNELGDKITALGMENLSVKKDIERIEGQKSDALESLKQSELGGSGLQREIEEQKQKIDLIHEQIEEKARQAEQLRSQSEGGRDQTAELIAQMNTLDKRVTEVNKEIREKMEDKEKFSGALAVAEERKGASEKERDRIKSSLWERYELAPARRSSRRIFRRTTI